MVDAFWKGIRDIFGHHSLRNDHIACDREAKTVSFGLENGYETCTFEQLERLSKLLGTKLINLRPSYVADEGCESCGTGRSVVLPVWCSGVKFPAINPCLFLIGGKNCGEEATNRTLRYCDTHAPLRCVKCGRQAMRQMRVASHFIVEDDIIVCNRCLVEVENA